MSRKRDRALLLAPLLLIALTASLTALSVRASSWVGFYGGPKDDLPYSLAATSDGGYVMAGSTESFGAGYRDALIFKVDSQGVIVWQKVIGGIYDDEILSIIQTGGGGFAAAGLTYSFNDGWLTAWLIRLDASGTVIWQKEYITGVASIAYKIVQVQDGGFVIAGTRYQTSTGGSPWLLRLNSAGEVLWAEAFGENSTFSTSGGDGESVIQLADGELACGFSFGTLSGYFGQCILKADASGTPLWAKAVGLGLGLDAGLVEGPDGSFVCAGGEYVGKLDANGNALWTTNTATDSEAAGYWASALMPAEGGGTTWPLTATREVTPF